MTNLTPHYRLALLQCRKVLQDGVLLDIGCGTGILSIFGAQAGARHVFAIEAAPGLCDLARGIISDNGLSSTITGMPAAKNYLDGEVQLVTSWKRRRGRRRD